MSFHIDGYRANSGCPFSAEDACGGLQDAALPRYRRPTVAARGRSAEVRYGRSREAMRTRLPFVPP